MAESEHDKKVKAKVEPRLADQRQREFLSDVTKGGGPDIPRPDQSFIDAVHNPKATDSEIHKHAHAEVWREELDKGRQNDQARQIASKMEGRQQRPAPENEKGKSGSLIDRFKGKNSSQDIGRGVGRNKGKDDRGIGD